MMPLRSIGDWLDRRRANDWELVVVLVVTGTLIVLLAGLLISDWMNY